ncbi:CMP-N-acetylneuraminic acid synthetase [Solibacillus sp. FSL H8-0538]|uniref:CMP-N-acetylneuraminic acid synthetase n=1 Tax=Solibacillus sp. FSL H8-0538 TaxID=2921400 RepID=UPI0030FB3CF0
MQKRKVAFIVEHCELKGLYPFKRAAILAQLLSEETVFVFIKTTNNQAIHYFTEVGFTPILFERFTQLPKHLRELSPDLIVHDGKDTAIDAVEQIRPFCTTLVHFDDFGEGAQLADCNIVALFEEVREHPHINELAGSYAYAVSDEVKLVADRLAEETEPETEASFSDSLPHIVVAFEDGDANNLTYRTLRHLTQLHIPLKISVAIDDDYAHSVEDLQMMVLSRRNTKVVRRPDALLHLMPDADLIICNASYTPYQVAAAGIACITAAQNERELGHAFPREANGFIHLGLGRKMKQSFIQNAVMELLLHDHRRERAVRKQRSLEIIHNNEILQALLLDFAYERHNIAHI